MTEKMGQISLYLAKDGYSFDDLVDEENDIIISDNYTQKDFSVSGCDVRFIYFTTKNTKKEPPWLTFINHQLDDDNQISFSAKSENANGVLFIKVDQKTLIAPFGMSGLSTLRKRRFKRDFGIITAMNMCDTDALRQVSSSTHNINPLQINRQSTKPSDSLAFGMSSSELLKYIAGHIKDNSNITLQGRDKLTIKAIGDDKFDWDKLIKHCKDFIKQYSKELYKEYFPNYINFQEASEQEVLMLDDLLLQKMKKKEFEKLTLAIPEFLADDDYRFSYSNHSKKDNDAHSFIKIEQLETEKVIDFDVLEIKHLQNKYIYIYSEEKSKILSNKKWSLYDCLFTEISVKETAYILLEGVWRKVDQDFYNEVEAFVEKYIIETDVSNEYQNIEIYHKKSGTNREGLFNEKYRDLNSQAIMFDRSKLKIGHSKRNAEFCDLLELGTSDQLMNIIHVKQYSGASSISYLFTQARFYCESFLKDATFLKEIRSFISNSKNIKKDFFLDYIKDNLPEIHGKDYDVSLWFLYDNKNPKPSKAELSLMAKYELKLTYEQLRNANKFNSIKISFIPIVRHPIKKAIKPN